jgi:hypothetical protein
MEKYCESCGKDSRRTIKVAGANGCSECKKILNELLEVLKRAQKFIARVDDLHQTIYASGLDEECQAAIAKAEGRS